MSQKHIFIKCNVFTFSNRLKAALKDRKLINEKSAAKLCSIFPKIKENRIAVSFISEGYPHPLHNYGLIFSTAEKPDSVLPFDGVVFEKIKDLEKEKPLVNFNEFIFDSIDSLLSSKNFSTRDKAMQKIIGNIFSVRRLSFYLNNYKNNEVIFNMEELKIKPIAFFGKVEKGSNLICILKTWKYSKDYPLYNTARGYLLGKKPSHKTLEKYLNNLRKKNKSVNYWMEKIVDKK